MAIPAHMAENTVATRVLIVEDDALLAEALAARAQQAGVMPIVCGDRPSALANAGGCAVAIIDLGLPPRANAPDEGLLVVETLALRHPDMTLVVQSGQEEASAAFAALAAGAWDFLAKPVSPTEFDAVLQRALRRAQAAQGLLVQGRSLPGGPAIELRGLKEASDAAQERLLRSVLAATNYNVAEAARRLGMQRERLYYYLDKFGIRRPHC